MPNIIRNTIQFCLAFIILGCSEPVDIPDIGAPVRSVDLQVGTRYLPLPQNAFSLPNISQVDLPAVAGSDAIWGATGQDDLGNIYLGFSTHGEGPQTSYLYQYSPSINMLTKQGNTLDQLHQAGIDKAGLGQNKLHSKFYQGDDGYLYFSSFDEQGESERDNPTWGGHLWRKRPDDLSWEHLLAAPEALIAVNTDGRFVYTLGYWKHMLYQYDSQTGKIKRAQVGSIDGHISRNLLVDHFGHVYVPEVSSNAEQQVSAHLNQYNTRLELVASYPLPSYQHKNMKAHHGIVAYTSLQNGHIMFTTSDGGLYRIDPDADGANKVILLGQFHPDGESYAASLFSFSGENFLVGLARKPKSKVYDWVIYELSTNTSVSYATTLDVGKYLLYGSSAKDKEGNMYIGGRQSSPNQKPVLFKVSY